MKAIFTLIIGLLFSSSLVLAQDAGSAVEYMNKMGTEFKAIQTATWDYTKAAANNRNAGKINKRRLELIQQIDASIKNVNRLPAFNKKTYLKDSVLSFLKIQKIVIEEDYGKIMDLEDIAESSYDAMEAYIKAKQIASDKMESSSQLVSDTYDAFAKENNVTIKEGEKDKITQQLAIADEVYGHYNEVYLIFFKPYKQELYVLDAMNKGDLAALEQNKVTLSKVSAESQAKLKAIKPFRGNDNSIRGAATELVNFYKEEADVKFAKLIDFYAKKDAFDKGKKAFEANKSKTNDDINAYNKLIDEFNKASNDFNTTNAELNKRRTALINEWNNACQNFTAKYL
ncbi:MAG: hypothetical protein K0R51_273 [Cytophagaceae bacterium]|jgi:hypothetical protein|nr:hypothetical protein [Cytophagaceae bacterium]